MDEWQQIVHKHGPLVWKLSWRLLGNEADAADCFQDTFVAAVEVGRREVVRNWGGLLYRLATLKAMDRRESEEAVRMLCAAVVEMSRAHQLQWPGYEWGAEQQRILRWCATVASP